MEKTTFKWVLLFVYLCRGIAQEIIKPLRNRGQQYDQNTTKGVEPQIGHPIQVPTNDHNDLGDDSGDKNCISLYKLEEECKEENAQYIPIKYRSDNVDQLYQIVKKVGHVGNTYGNHYPY